jgi:hypothetical protein
MPSEIRLTIIKERNLPIMDFSRKTTDAYCLIKFGKGQNTLDASKLQKQKQE